MPEYFTLTDLRALPDMGSTSKYPDARCEAAAAFVVSRIEKVVDSSFIRRSVTEVHDAGEGPDGALVLRKRHPFQVTALVENGIIYGAPELAQLVIDGPFLRRRIGGSWTSFRPWLPGIQNITVTYDAGFSASAPGDVKEAALEATRDRLLVLNGVGGYNARARSVTNEFGTTSLAVADEDHPFGIPDVDAVIIGYREEFETVIG